MIKYLTIMALLALLALPPFFWRRLAYQTQADALRQRRARLAYEQRRDEACRLLGVSKTATVNEIRAAHLRMIRQYHPDLGGSKDLAASINAAKDLLLG